jgi:hypothetical protein
MRYVRLQKHQRHPAVQKVRDDMAGVYRKIRRDGSAALARLMRRREKAIVARLSEEIMGQA